MVDITNLGNNERIKNIYTFLQNSNPLGTGDESVKSVLALEIACEELTSTEQMKKQRNENIPKLLKPKMMMMKMSPQIAGSKSQKGFNGTALLIETFSTLRQLLHEGNLGELKNRLELINAESESLRNQGSELLNSFANSAKEAERYTIQTLEVEKNLNLAKEQLNNITDKQKNLQQTITNNKDRLANIKLELAENKKILAQINALEKPITEEAYQVEVAAEAKIAELNTQFNQLTNEQATLEASSVLLTNQKNEFNLKIDTLQSDFEGLADKSIELTKVSEDNRNKLTQFIETTPRNVELDGEKWENTLALLTLLTAQLKKAISEDSVRNMKEQEEVMMKINEASRRDSEKKAKEAEASERKAAEANKAASCTSKIFSYILLAVSVIATVATLGAATPLTLAVAAIGIAIAVTDIVLEETGHSSLMQMLADQISYVVTNMLIEFGVPEEKAKQIGSIVGMIVAAIAFLALSLLSMGSAIKSIPSMIKNIPKMIKGIIKSVPKSLTNALGNISTKVADSADSMAKLSKLAKLSDKFDEVKHTAKAISQIADKADKSSDVVSIGGQMVKVGDSVADSGDSVVSLSKFAKLSDKFDDITDVSSSAKHVVDSVNKQSVGMARLEVAMKGTGAVMSITNTAATGGLRLDAAANIRDMKAMLAGMMLNDASIQALTELLNALIKAMSKETEKLSEMFNGILGSLQESNNQKVEMLKMARFG
ncbi:type III secretion system translocon subunit SctE [Providencia vermicola]|uniref:type III secretion system translocon subunit SctE n=1 Tax=Providencia vermicola TaxID=333965 RepID=UPI0032DAABBE